MKTPVLLSLALPLVLTASASAGTLYGIDYSAASPALTTVVTINESNAATTALFSFATFGAYRPQGLAFNPNTGHLYSVGESVVGSTFSSGLYDIDLTAQTGTFVPIAGNLNVEGIDFLASANSLVVSYSPNSYYTFTLGAVSTLGVMGATNGLPTTDSDVLGIDPTTSDLMVYDASNPTGIYSLNRIFNPFGAASAVGVYSGPVDPVHDLDLASDGGSLFLTNGSSLVQFAPGLASRSTVGSYALGGRKLNVVGIAAAPVPEPASLLALGAGAAAMLRRRRLG